MYGKNHTSLDLGFLAATEKTSSSSEMQFKPVRVSQN